MQHWFVYYKLDAAAARDLEPRIRTMQRTLSATTGIPGRLMQRADGGAQSTLMEVYEGIDDAAAFDAALARAIEQAKLPSALVGQRRTERFVEREG